MFVTDPEDCYYTKKVCDLHVRNISYNVWIVWIVVASTLTFKGLYLAINESNLMSLNNLAS